MRALILNDDCTMRDISIPDLFGLNSGECQIETKRSPWGTNPLAADFERLFKLMAQARFIR